MRKGKAKASSAGIVFGAIQKLDEKHQFIPEYKIEPQAIKQEVIRFQQAITQASAGLEEEMNQLANHHRANDLVPILQAHQMMLQDPELVIATQQLIEDEGINVEWALKKRLGYFAQAFADMDDVYLRSRKADIEHVGQCVFNCLTETESSEYLKQSIMVALDFSPSEIVSMWRSGVSGFVTVQGGEDSHAMILARGVGLPGLAGVHDLFAQAEDGDTFILDGEQGEWVLKPNQKERVKYRQIQKQLAEKNLDLAQYAQQVPGENKHHRLSLLANLEFVEEVMVANQYGVDGVGLFRTEFLFMQTKTLPSEEEQFEYYKQIAQGMQGKSVTFRLLDVGADKLCQIEEMLEVYGGENPALGLRGVRMLLHKPDMLKAQLRAIIRCAEFTDVAILVPMVVSDVEMLKIRQALDAEKQDLGIHASIALGCMIEVPAAVFVADALAEVADFFSIGSNDLVQYSLAVDRADEHVGYLYDVNHQAIKSLIQMAVDAAHRHRIPVTVCGELAANKGWTQTFLDMNISGLSMSSQHILSMRKHLQDL